MEFRILGTLEVASDGRDLTPPRRKQRVLLTLLLLRADDVVASDELIEALWGEFPPETAPKALHGHVSALRKLLGSERIETRAPGYVFRPDGADVDLHRFERLVVEARELDPAQRAEALQDALALFRGEPLADFRYEAFARTEALRIDELRLAALEQRIEADLVLGRHGDVVAELEQLVAEHPLRERFRAQLMLALYRSGRQADALEAYQDARTILVEELGIEPAPALQRLERQILNHDTELAEPRAVGAVRRLSSLPSERASLVGRKREIREVVELLERRDVRLLTLSGTGGTGKTRLALAAAERVLEAFADGVAFVSLGSLANPELVVLTIGQTLGVRESVRQSASDAVSEYLRSRELLLVLDNLEHLLPAAPDVAELLARAPALKVLATSRTPIHVSGEHVYTVPSLSMPESVALFDARAGAANRAFAVTPENKQDVEEICMRLDGLPLAIELAAPRVALLSPAALVYRVEQRLQILTGGPVDAPHRHQALRATIDWSHDLLASDEQVLFRRLAVFAGGCTIDAAESVYGDDGSVLDGLQSLVEKSLLKLDDSGGGRFSMLETIREYALERLIRSGEEELVREQHLDYYTALAEAAYAARRRGHSDWLRTLDSEADNLRTALDWAAISRPAVELQLAGAAGWFWLIQMNLEEGRERLTTALARDSEPNGNRARALLSLSRLIRGQGKPDESFPICEDALRLARRIGDEELVITALEDFGAAACQIEEYGTARRAFAEGLEISTRRGDDEAALFARIGICQLLVIDAEVDAAEPLAEELLEAAARNGDVRAQQFALHFLGDCPLIRGDYDTGATRYARSIAFAREHGFRAMRAEELLGVAMCVAGQGDYQRALYLAAAARTEYVRLGGGPRWPFWERLQEWYFGGARALLGPIRAAEAEHAGRDAPFEALLDAVIAFHIPSGYPPVRAPAGDQLGKRCGAERLS